MNVRSIIREYLKDNGYDGLYNAGHCACLVDDLAPCEGDPMKCKPGYKTECDGNCDYDRCDWHISGKKDK